MIRRTLVSIAGLAVVLGTSAPAVAGPVSCDPGSCGWTISVNSQVMASGGFAIDEGGGVTLTGNPNVVGNGFTANISGLSGNVDPELVFGVGATNNTGNLATFSFAFSLPLGGFPGGSAVATSAVLSTALTAPTNGTAMVFPVLGVGKIVDSQDVRLSPYLSVDKGVDIGDVFAALAGQSLTRTESAMGTIAAGSSFDIMAVTIAFGLDDTGNGTGVGLSGRVTQVAPEPGALLLLGFGLLGASLARRRRA
jgi:hypothetical protein